MSAGHPPECGGKPVAGAFRLLTPVLLFAVLGVVLYACSALRHELFHSSAYDLGWFDQALFLISRGEAPIVSFSGSHILGDHAAFVLYLLVPLYAIYPTVHWLLAVQAAAFAGAAALVHELARTTGASRQESLLLGVALLLYPLVLNLALFDFHPEVLAVPATLAAVLAARRRKALPFALALLVAISCKEILALNAIALGAWMLLCERRRGYGLAAVGAGTLWFAIATVVVIPAFSGGPPAAIARYGTFGGSLIEVATGVFTHLDVTMARLFSLPAVRYIGELAVPVAWGLSPAHLAPLIGAAPTVAANLLSDYPQQRSLLYQYSAPALPFLFLTLISARAAGRGRPRSTRLALAWSILAFVGMAQYDRLWTDYVSTLDTWDARRDAIALIDDGGPVLTTSDLAPHLTHRRHIAMTDTTAAPPDLRDFAWVLLDLRHPGWRGSADLSQRLIDVLSNDGAFAKLLDRDGVLLFARQRT